jgi:hypothetical protein
MEPGVQAPEETLTQRQGIVPRFELAAGAILRNLGLCRAVRLRAT